MTITASLEHVEAKLMELFERRVQCTLLRGMTGVKFTTGQVDLMCLASGIVCRIAKSPVFRADDVMRIEAIEGHFYIRLR